MSIPNKIGFYRDGLFRRHIKKYSTASTAAYDLSRKESGTIFQCNTVSTISFRLPKGSSKWLGLTYEFYFSTAADVGDYTVGCIDTSGVIQMAYSSLGVGTPSTITPETTNSPHALRVTLLSSIIWIGENLMQEFTTAAKAIPVGGWTTG